MSGCERHGRQDCEECFEEAVGLRGPQDFPWRVGRKVGRTIYACKYEPGDLIGGRASGLVIVSDHDDLIGVMDTPELATAAVNAHNAAIGFGPAPSEEQTATSAAPSSKNRRESQG
jgi:hypothetical protein